MKTAALALTVLLSLTPVGSAKAGDTPPPNTNLGVDAGPHTFDVEAWRTSGHQHKATTRNPAQQIGAKPEPRQVAIVPACDANDLRLGGADGGVMCPRAVNSCAGAGYLVWVFTTTTMANAGPADWSLRDQYCVQPGDDPALRPGRRQVPAFTQRDFARLRLPAGGMHLQPDSGEVLITMPTNLYVSAQPVRQRTRLLGIDVEVQATPSSFTWTFGDGQTLTTTDAGHPYPNMTTTHTFQHPGTYRVTLATTYTGAYRIAGDRTWLPIDGTVTIPSPAVTVTAIETRAVLVN